MFRMFESNRLKQIQSIGFLQTPDQEKHISYEIDQTDQGPLMRLKFTVRGYM